MGLVHDTGGEASMNSVAIGAFGHVDMWGRYAPHEPRNGGRMALLPPVEGTLHFVVLHGQPKVSGPMYARCGHAVGDLP